MSGVFGLLSNDELNGDNDTYIDRMHKWNRAYGRDNEELYQRGKINLGCCYEKLAKAGKVSSLVIKNEHTYAVIDALVYNREEIAMKCNLTTKLYHDDLCDEDLLFAFITKFGINYLKEVNGDFSGAIYDEKEKTLTLFRDHMGVRPLFYYADDNIVAFSTDIRGLLALKTVDSSINEDWVYRTVGGYYMDGLTCTEYKNIFCVNPGSYICFSIQEGLTVKENIYWKPGSIKIRLSDFEEYKNKLKELVTDAVKRRLDAVSGTVGAELSGGLDSGVIDILINRLGRECVYYSWSVDPLELPYAKNDERLVINDICRQEGITCQFSKMKSNYGMESNIAKKMSELGIPLDKDEPPALRYVLPPYINALTICETCECMNQNGVKVVFTGHGGDEGVSHRCNPYELFYYHEYYHFIRQLWSVTHGQKGRILKTIKSCFKVLCKDRKYFKRPFHMPFGAPELLNKDFAGNYSEKDMPLLHFAYSPTEYIKEGGSRNRLDGVALLGAYNGVRYLVPYLDYRVIDFAVSIPRHLYMKGTNNRYIFREAFKEIMPESLYSLKFKEDNSKKNYVDNPDWFLEFAKRKDEINKKLDRNFWSPYLNFDVIDAWMKKGKPSDEERRHDNNILMCLFYCAMAQNMIDKA